MKNVCKICGYVYDDAKESVPFAELPDEWVCPICGAPKSEFKAEAGAEQTQNKKMLTYRCLICGAVFQIPEGEDPVCPRCGMTGNALKLIDEDEA